MKDLSGKKFGKLYVIEKTDQKNSLGRYLWRCFCDCGKECLVVGTYIANGKTKSCGCIQKERREHLGSIVNARKQSLYKYSVRKNRNIYAVWRDMKRRCYDPKDKSYSNYGGRGIKVCDDWIGEFGFYKFAEWAYKNGYRDDAEKGQCTLDRKNVNGNYEPKNCKFSTAKEQGNNIRTNVILEYNGEKHTVTEWAEITGISRTCLYKRVNRGWSIKDILTKESMRMS